MKISFSTGEKRYLKPNLYDFVIIDVKHNDKGKFSNGWDLHLACLNDKPVYDINGKVLEGQSSFDMKIRTTLWYRGTSDSPIFNSKMENGLKAICIGSGVNFDENGELDIEGFEDLKGCMFKALVSNDKAKDGNVYNTVNPESIVEADEQTVALAEDYQAINAGEKKFVSKYADKSTDKLTVRKPLVKKQSEEPVEEEEEIETTEESVEEVKPIKRDRRAIFGK